jgi:ribosomal protein L11 methyltransferase
MRVPIDDPTDECKDAYRIREAILTHIKLSAAKITQSMLEKHLVGRFGLTRAAVRHAVGRLVAEGVLGYSYEHGCSFLKPAYNRPVHIGRHLILKPPQLHYVPAAGEVVIQIMPGASFGSGEHPTTRLALRAIEQVLRGSPWFPFSSKATTLDVGTGSGTLLIAAVCLGACSGVGIDIDPCARFEAQENVRVNRIEDRVIISDAGVADLSPTFSLISANLRLPTLKQLAVHLTRLCSPRGAMVLSGLHCEELPDLLTTFQAKRFDCRWRVCEQDWAAVVLQNKKQV